MTHAAYLDNAASAPLRPEVLKTLEAHLRHPDANPSAIHALGQEARKRVERARKEVADLVQADVSEVVFTSGATEANNLAIRGVLEPLLDAGRRPHVITSALEHASVIKTLESLVARGLELTVIPPGTDGVIRVEDVLGAIRPETALVSITAVSNEVGSRQPVEAIGAALRRSVSRPMFHVDAVQAIVSTDVTFATAKADLFTISAHKIGGPKGVGALVVRRGSDLSAILTGGGQESGRRSGTENTFGISGFGTAASALVAAREREIASYRKLRGSLLGRLPAGARQIMPADSPVAPHILALECIGKENDWIVLLMSREGVMVAAGSACKSGSREASGAVKAMGLDDQGARSVIRVSFGHATDEKDVDAFIDALSRSLAR